MVVLPTCILFSKKAIANCDYLSVKKLPFSIGY